MSQEYCRKAPQDPIHEAYHNEEYGFPIKDECLLFERLSLEIMQAGLSWGTVLKKRTALFEAFDGFDAKKVAAYDDNTVQKLLKNAAIIRNKLKINAIIHNAHVVLTLRDTHGGFAAWLDNHHPQSKRAWVALFRETFAFTGEEITGEFLMSIGYLRGAHVPSCPIYGKIAHKRPPWSLR
ncbi:MAG: DNA-3-methyladenine glycosylase I [Alphaproteobacteria bacterium]|nr:DNA-3-methyladenine glycosylase I [Alphaproteobacteria bacterium]